MTGIRFCGVVRVPLGVAPSLGMNNTLAPPDNFPISRSFGTGQAGINGGNKKSVSGEIRSLTSLRYIRDDSGTLLCGVVRVSLEVTPSLRISVREFMRTE